MTKLFGYVGRSFITFLQDLSSMVFLFWETLAQSYVLFRDPKRRRRAGILQSVDAIGSQSLPLVLTVSSLIGIVLTVLSAANLDDLGMLNYIPGFVMVSILRFTAPMMTGILVAGRMGAAFTARIGTMKVSEEILALEVMAINPVRYLVVQRFIGMLISLPALTVLASFSAIFCSLLYGAGRLGIGPNIFVREMVDVLTVTDVLSGIVKSLVYAVVIAMIGCYRGLVVEGSAEAVGRATMMTVIWSMLSIIVLDTFLTTAFYG